MPREARLTRTINGPVEQVFEAWTDPGVLARWWGPGDHTAGDVTIDARPGGTYRIEHLSPDGRRLAVTGRYEVYEPPSRLSFTWRWEEGVPDAVESRVTIELTARGDRTELTLVHDGFPDETAAAPYGRGWNASLPKLEALFA